MSDFQESITSIAKEHNTRRHLSVVVCMIAVATVLAVFWSLHIKGITLASGDLICGMEEHTHSEDCYAWVPLTDDTEETTELEELTEGTETAADTETPETETIDTESATETVLSETGTEALTEDGSEALTEEETEAAQVGDTKIANGVEYVYTLICGMEEHAHTEDCYADASEKTESEETANASSLNAGVASLGITRLGSGTDSSGISTASIEEEDNSGIATISEEESEEESSNLLGATASSDTYYFADTTTLADAAENQDNSYIVYTIIEGDYYIVSADNTLVPCTYLDTSAADFDLATATATEGIYYWLDDDNNPVFKCTNSSTDDIFEDYSWTLSGTESDNSGSGTYTFYNSANSTYIAPQDVGVSETLNGTSWWIDYQKGKDYSLSSDAMMIFTVDYTEVTVSGTAVDGGFMVEVYDGTNDFYIDTGSNYDCWFTPRNGDTSNDERRSYGSAVIEITGGTGAASLTSGETYTVVVERNSITTDNNGAPVTTDTYVITYYNSASEVLLQYTATGITHTDNAVSVRIYAQQGTYEISAVYATKKSSSVDTSSVEINDLTLKDVTTDVVTDESVSYNNTDYDARTGQITIEGDFSITYKFINWGSNTASPRVTDYNYVLGLLYESGEYLFLQPNYSYSTMGTNTGNLTVSLGSATGSVDSNWVSKMNAGQTSGGTTWVTLTIERKKNVVTISTDLDRGGSFYSYETTVIDSASDEAITLFLTARNANITSLSVTSSSNEYDITGYDAYGAVGTYNTAVSVTADTSNGSISLATATSKFLDSVTLTADSTSTASFVKSGAGNTVFYLAKVRSYSAYFDGTNGGTYSSFGGDNPSIVETTTTMDASGENFYLTVPTAAIIDTRNNRANITLNGWLDIYNAKYYEVGDVLTIPYGSSSYEIVCYADWVASDYDGGSSSDASYVESLDTSSFITTNVFDYNDLINTYSAYLYDRGSSLTATKTWRTSYVNGPNNLFDLTGVGFLFLKSGGSPLLNVSDRAETELLKNSSLNGQYTGAYTGILTYDAVSDELLEFLYDTEGDYAGYDKSTEEGIIGKTWLGTGNYLFQYNSTYGYYYFDSSKNAAFYNQTDGRFYLYDFLVRYNTDTSTSDFFPFSYDETVYGLDMSTSYEDQTIVLEAPNIDYYFGMSTSIDFYLPDDTGYVDGTSGEYGNQSSQNSHMAFKFMGDDDVWVFVDDELVLDLGGIHDAIYGEIDFSTGVITVITNTDALNNSTKSTYVDDCIDTDSDIIDVDTSKITLPNTADLTGDLTYAGSTGTAGTVVGSAYTYSTIEAGAHTLTIYYLERGASESNSAIYFNISSATYNLELEKVDEEGNSQGTDAEFTFYTDEDFLYEASLAKEQDGTAAYSTFTSSETAYGLKEGRTYYVKETKSPTGLTAAGRYFTVCLKSGVLTITVYDSSGTVTDIYEYTLTLAQNQGGSYYCDVSYTPEATTTEWKYVKQSSIDVTPTVNTAGTVTYYAIELTIVNTAEYELASTGGTGITSYLVAGEVLILIAGLGLILMTFYYFVWTRRFRAIAYKKDVTEEKTKKQGALYKDERAPARTEHHARASKRQTTGTRLIFYVWQCGKESWYRTRRRLIVGLQRLIMIGTELQLYRSRDWTE